MIRKNFIAVVSLSIFMLTVGLPMTGHAGLDKGDSNLTLSGSFFHAQGADSGTLNLEAAYGYLFTQGWEVGVQQSIGYSFIDDADDQWVGSTIPYLNYHFQGLSQNDGFLPFVGVFAGASYNDDDVTGTIGPQLGFKSFVNDRTFIMVKYRYEWFFDELTVNDIEDTSSDGNHVVTFGLGFAF